MRLAAAGEALVGAPYRLHGRDPVTGIDCVGLILCALRKAGRPPVELPHYGLRNLSIAHHLDFAACNGLEPCVDAQAAGDVLLVRVGPAQHHLLLALDAATHAHAHLGARHVIVEQTRAPSAVIARWRPCEQE